MSSNVGTVTHGDRWNAFVLVMTPVWTCTVCTSPADDDDALSLKTPDNIAICLTLLHTCYWAAGPGSIIHCYYKKKTKAKNSQS